MEYSEKDVQFMTRAVWLANLGTGITSPNPPVGAVIVKHGRIIGEGYHKGAGMPHAEREAIADAMDKGNSEFLAGSTLYVTLEPCSTHGRTPPCTDAIIEQGISRVVFGTGDPNPANAGKAARILTERGITVETGLMEQECRELVKAFSMATLHARPWIIAKTAMTIDGRIARATGKERWITGPAARNHVHTLRALSDAVLVGGETLRCDDPALTIRTPDRPVSALKKQPWRIVLTRDRQLLPENSVCFTDEWADRTLVIEDVVDYRTFLASIVRDYGIHTLMLECGGRLLRQFLDLQVVDEWVSFHAPFLTGGSGLAVAGEDFLPAEAYLESVDYTQYDRDICIKGYVGYSR